MSAAPLTSVHLGSHPRREEFRRARQALLEARGEKTILAEKTSLTQPGLDHPTQHSHIPASPYVLSDGQTLYPLRVGINTLGRLADSLIVLPARHISRRHCAILVHADGSCALYDTASRNGTHLNGKRLTCPMQLTSGDKIRLCEHQFVVMTATEATQRPNTSIDHDTLLGS